MAGQEVREGREAGQTEEGSGARATEARELLGRRAAG